MKRKKTAILVFDGEHWHAGVFAYRRHVWVMLESTTLPSRSMKQLPGSVIEWLTSKQVASLRILLPADLHTLPMEMPDDVEHEELHTALAYEMAEEMGREAHLLRLATVEASVYGMGCEAGVYMMAGFDSRQIDSYVQQLKPVGIRFEGVGALELGLLSLHAQYPEERLLLLRHRSGFYVVPGLEGQPFYMTSVQTGLEEEKTDREQERLRRLQRRLKEVGSIPLRVVTATADGVPAEQRVHCVVPDADRLDISALDAVMPQLMEQVLGAKVSDSNCACPLVGPTPAPKDPARAGTWICLGILLLTAVYIGTRWYYMRVDLRGEVKRMAAWKVLTGERESTSSECSHLKKERNQLNRVYNTLTQTNRMPRGLLTIVDVLATSIPQYTRITRISQTGPEEFVMDGTTRWAKGKIQLDRVLSRELSRTGMLVEPGQMTYQEDAREQQFIYRVGPRGGAS